MRVGTFHIGWYKPVQRTDGDAAIAEISASVARTT